MGIWTRIVLIMLPFILCFMQLSQSMENGKCTRTNLGNLTDLLSLTKRLFDRSTNLNENILPGELKLKSRNDFMMYQNRLMVVSSLLSIISQNDRYKMTDEDNQEVNTLDIQFKRLTTVTCKFMMSIGIDCSNASATEHVLQLLKLREQAIKSYELLKDLSLARDYNEEYVTWNNKVEPNFNMDETRGLFGSFPFYSSTCRTCNFGADQCPNPHV